MKATQRVIYSGYSGRPREKLARYGATRLSDFELLQALIGRGNAQAGVTQIAKEVRKLLRWHGAAITYEQLSAIKGVGQAKAAEILAAFELGKRYLLPPDAPVLYTSEDAVAQLTDLRHKKQEYFMCLTLDGAHRLIAKRVISIGTLTSSLVHPREVFADAIADRAAAVIVAHNHPSGSLNPSAADYGVTERLRAAAELLGLTFVEHLIVTAASYARVD